MGCTDTGNVVWLSGCCQRGHSIVWFAFRNCSFDFRQRPLSGEKALRPRDIKLAFLPLPNVNKNHCPHSHNIFKPGAITILLFQSFDCSR